MTHLNRKTRAGRLLVLLGAGASAAGLPLPSAQAVDQAEAVSNDNRRAAGLVRGDTLHLELELKETVWRPEGPDGHPIPVYAFAEAGQPASVPGPLVRVRTGMVMIVSVTNRLSKPAVLHGLSGRHDADPLNILPGQTARATVRAGSPGTGFYWARTTTGGRTVGRTEDSQLAGAFIVDSAGPLPAHERVLVITAFDDSVPLPPGSRYPGRKYQAFAINGAAWPHTERLRYTQGDTVTWRVVNVSDHVHPMHLHGFFFDVTSRGSPLRDTVYAAADRRAAVTELIWPSTTISMSWVASEPGRWLYHCHMINHIDTALRSDQWFTDGHAGHEPSHDRVEDVMSGLVTAVEVTPAAHRPVAPEPVARQVVRVYVTERPVPAGQPRLSYVVQRGAHPPAADSVVAPSDAIELTQGEPAEIIVTNLARRATSVHWHGLELESYYDGVVGWSGWGGRLAPMIAPGDSFAVRLTPRRAGTYLYHTHADEMVQLPGGLFAPFIVHAKEGPVFAERVLIISDRGVVLDPRLGGAAAELEAGVTYRLRLASIPSVSVMAVRLLAGTGLATWRPVAKDGADLPAGQQRDRTAQTILGAGETLDVLLRAEAGQLLELEVGALGSSAPMRAPMVVRPAGPRSLPGPTRVP